MSRYRLVAAAIIPILVLTACATAASPSPAASGPAGTKFAGISVNILTFNGPQVAEPLQRRAPDWQQLTGGHVNVVAVGFQTIYDKALLDASTGTNSFDGYVFDPQWLGDFVGPGYLLDLSDRVTADTQLDWQDIGPFFRDFNATYNGKVYTIPLDGDFHMVYYRSDLLKKDGLNPPATWDDYMTIAQKYNGQDLNGDGEPDYGSCIAKKKGAQSYWWIISIAAGLLQAKGTNEGAFFDTANMDPLLGDNEAMAKALEMYAQTATVGPPDELNMDVGGTRGLFTTGRCALSMDWGDIGTLTPGTYAQDKTGATITPGWKEVLDRSTGSLVPCDEHHLPERRRRRQLRPVRLVRRLVGRRQRGLAEGEPGRRVRLPFVHERPGPVRHRRDAGQDRLQPVPDLALHEHQAVDGRRLEPGRRRELPWRHQVQSREQEHGPGHADPADQALPAGRARYRGIAVPRRRTRCRRRRKGNRRWLECDHRGGGEGRPARSLRLQPWRRAITLSPQKPGA